MRRINLIVLLLLSVSCFCQPMVVHNKNDKKLLAYQDSLRKYNKFISLKKQIISELDKTQVWSEYRVVIDKYTALGIFENHELHRNKNTWEVIYRWNRFNQCCIKTVRQPKLPIIYKPEYKVVRITDSTRVDSNVKVVYITERLDGRIIQDSTKKNSYTKKIITSKDTVIKK